MRYFISFTLFLFCSISLFSQERVDTTTLTLKDTCIIKEKITITNYIAHLCVTIDREVKIGCSITSIPIKRYYPVGIVHTNHSAFGLPIYPFRFENVNQMANTVAGVLSMDSERPSILGARREGTAYYINGVRVLEGFLPEILD